MTYQPRPGSIAERLVSALSAGRKSRAELAKSAGVLVENIEGNIRAAVDSGLVRKFKLSGFTFYELAGEPIRTEPQAATDADDPVQIDFGPSDEPVDDAPFEARLYADGDLEIFGAFRIVANDVRGVRLDAEQAEQIKRLLNGTTVAG